MTVTQSKVTKEMQQIIFQKFSYGVNVEEIPKEYDNQIRSYLIAFLKEKINDERIHQLFESKQDFPTDDLPYYSSVCRLCKNMKFTDLLATRIGT